MIERWLPVGGIGTRAISFRPTSGSRDFHRVPIPTAWAVKPALSALIRPKSSSRRIRSTSRLQNEMTLGPATERMQAAANDAVPRVCDAYIDSRPAEVGSRDG